MKEKISLTEGNVHKTLLVFAFPFMLAQLMQALYGAVDLIVVGQFADTADVSAVSTGSEIMYLASFIVLGFASAVTVLMGQYFGAGERERLSRLTGASILFFLFSSLLLSFLTALFRSQIVTFMNTPEEAVAPALDYILICSVGLSFTGGYHVVCGILRALGDSRTPLLFVAAACVFNIILDIVLVRNFQMGAGGAALATSFAQGLSFVFSLIYLWKKGLGFPFSVKNIRFHREEIWSIIRVGAPIVAQDSLTELSFLLITVIINGMGLVVSAAVGVTGRLIGFLFIPTIGMSMAVSAMCAQNYGAGKYDRALACMKSGILFSLFPSVTAAVCSQFLGETLTGLFISDPEVIGQAALYLKAYSLDCVLVAVVFNMNGYFNGFGRTFFTMAHSLAATFFGRLPLTFLLSQAPGVTLLEMGTVAPASTLISVFLCVWYLWQMKKRKETKKRNTGYFAAD